MARRACSAPGFVHLHGASALGWVLLQVATRRSPDWQERRIALATIQLLWPAYFRPSHPIPGVPDPELWFGGLEYAYFDQGVLRPCGQWLYALLT